ncbi:ArnT family glycosyltransferase [Celerinatantimonas sp. YJH-8]|uniref:ArnT family glycosyltransferase n=1 Tax=Celerinatantimonas sp. YJH-8 TaxID=3228714 RepID=UPI0038C1D7FA
MLEHKKILFISVTLSLAFILMAITYIPLFPIDQTRYISVAWEMWTSHNYLVPHLNGLPYPDKPPLLFWIINIFWSIWGPSTFLTRLIIPLLSLFNLIVVYQLNKKIYHSSYIVSPLILMSFGGWLLYSSLTMFDLLLTLFIQLAMWFTFKYFEKEHKIWMIMTGLCIGLALLTKGPVTFVFMLPFFTFVKLFKLTEIKNLTCYKFFIITSLIGIVIILLWAVPAAAVGGEHYADAIFWKQSAGRISHSFAHKRPFYWYLLVLPLLLFPFTFFKSLWTNKPWLITHSGDKFCLTLIATIIFIFSCFSGKQIHYLFPIFPIIAIWISSKLTIEKATIEPIIILLLIIAPILVITSPMWTEHFLHQHYISNLRSYLSIIPELILILSFLLTSKIKTIILNTGTIPVCISTILIALSPILYKYYNVQPEAKLIATLQQKNIQVNYIGKYPNTFGFLGHLKEPLNILNTGRASLADYLKSHQGYTVWIENKAMPTLTNKAILSSPYRGQWIYIIKNKFLYQYLTS